MALQCSRCNGEGKVEIGKAHYATCRKCGGDGKVGHRNCSDCGRSLVYCSIHGWFCKKCDYVNYDTHVAKHMRGECSGSLSNQTLYKR